MLYSHNVEEAIKKLTMINAVYKDRTTRKYEIIIERKMRGLFGNMEREIVRLLNEKQGTDLSQMEMRRVMTAIERHHEEYLKTIINTKSEIGQKGKNRIVRQLQLAGYNIQYTSLSSRVKELLTRDAISATEYGIDNIKNQVSNILTKAYEDGIGHRETAKIITDKFSSLGEFHSRIIARTEINSAQNRSKYETIQEYPDIINFKQWWSAEDERVRDGTLSEADHVKMHGQIAYKDLPFSNNLYYPGDKNGDKDEWMGCRCTIIVFIMPFGYRAPIGKEYFYPHEIVKIS